MVDKMEETKEESNDCPMEESPQDEIIPAESGMANVFANILSKRPRSVKVPILAKVVKRKTPADRKPKKTVDFDVVKPCSSSSDSEGEEDINEKSYEGNALPKKLKKKKLRQEERNNMCRGKPDLIKDREKERNLVRLATKGVVQLFNAVKSSQTTVEEQLTTTKMTERSKEKILKHVSKGEFFKLHGKTGKSASADGKLKTETKKEPVGKWKVLQDDFLGDSSLKDWDKQDVKQE